MCSCLIPTYSQTKVVKGNIYAFKDLSLKNIKISSKKTKSAMLSDSLGRFTIVCAKNDKLVFSGNGFQKVIKSVKNKDSLSIRMILSEGSEEVAIGYGHVKKEDLVYSVSHYSAYNNIYANFTDIFDLIQVEFPSVQVTNHSGSERKILIRGISSLSDNIYAAYVVDGIMVDDISTIAPLEVKDIDILKDGAAAIYGSRGANGVVLITTRDR